MTDIKYYHVSPAKNTPSIKRFGLRPGHDGAVHLSTDMGRAIMFVHHHDSTLPLAVWSVTGLREPQSFLTETGRPNLALGPQLPGTLFCDIYLSTSFIHIGGIPPERVTLEREHIAPGPSPLTVRYSSIPS